MAVTKPDTIETLAILGGLGTVLNPIIMLFMSPWNYMPIYANYPSAFFLNPRLLIFMFSFFSGLIILLLTIRAVQFVSEMPKRAATELIIIGIVVIIIGLIFMFSWLTILSGIVILVAGSESDAVWKRIQRARRQTGWPYRTIPTATGDPWARRLSCRFCGAPLIIRAATARGDLVQVESHCSLDKTTETIQLPLSQLEAWSSFMADRLHRCEQCGDRTVALIVLGQDRLTTRLQAFCPHGHLNRFYRRIWTPLYPHVARIPTIDVGFRTAQVHPRFTPSITPTQTQPINLGHIWLQPRSMPTAASVTQPISISTTQLPIEYIKHPQYCSNCGVRIETADIYCFRCGNKIN